MPLFITTAFCLVSANAEVSFVLVPRLAQFRLSSIQDAQTRMTIWFAPCRTCLPCGMQNLMESACLRLAGLAPCHHASEGNLSLSALDGLATMC